MGDQVVVLVSTDPQCPEKTSSDSGSGSGQSEEDKCNAYKKKMESLDYNTFVSHNSARDAPSQACFDAVKAEKAGKGALYANSGSRSVASFAASGGGRGTVSFSVGSSKSGGGALFSG